MNYLDLPKMTLHMEKFIRPIYFQIRQTPAHT